MATYIRLDIEYDGTDFVGWQRQPEGRTVQGVLETALAHMFSQPVSAPGAGRTDAGVHAKGQVARFLMPKPIPLRGLVLGLCDLLPSDVSVTRASQVSEEFHPRYSAISKTYVYRLLLSRVRRPLVSRISWRPPLPLDVERMRQAASRFLGEHDFRSFSASEGTKGPTKRSLHACDVIDRAEIGEVLIVINASGFLNRMARMMVGTLVEIGRGRMEAEDIDRLFHACQVGSGGPSAPARGLCLERVEYPPAWDLPVPGQSWGP